MSDERRVGLLRRHRDFRLLWCGETAGKFGSSVTSVAMPLIAVSTLDATTLEVGVLSASAWLPWLVIGLPAGAWVDRMRRRPVMLTAAAVSFLLFSVIPGAAWTGRLSVGLLVVIALLTGVVAGNVIKASFQQRYCPPELLGRLTASTSFLNYGTIPLGALLGGWLGTVFDLRTAMWITTAGVPLAALILVFSPIGRARDLPTAPASRPGRTVRSAAEAV
ncbi:MFS transporter [Streptomyces sp. NPDC020480]|uniref:MFS transporter n=1 Tax=Streptomyces sp. NPDC020480 TaxID=3365076 RepID=UPI0037A90DC4